MKKIALTQPALNHFAKLPGGAAELRKQRKEAEAHLARIKREMGTMIADLEALIKRIGIALGEVSA